MQSSAKEFLKKIIPLSLPIALQNLVVSILNIFDQMMVGWLPGGVADNCLAAVLLANQIVFIFQELLFAACGTCIVFISQYAANGKEKDIPKRVGFLFCFNVSIAIVMTVLCGAFPQVCIGLFNPDEAYRDIAVEFLGTVAFSFIPMAVTLTFTFSMRAIKRMKVGLTANITAVLLNIAFNYWFMFGGLGVPAMGLIGAAYGTIISRTAEMLIAIGGMLIFRYPIIASPKKMFAFGDGFFKKFIRLFIPILCNELFWVLSGTVYLYVYDKIPDSEVALAAVNIAKCVDNIVSVAMIGLGSAVGILIGNQIGAGDYETAKDYARKSILFSLVLGFVMCALTAAAAFVAPLFFTKVSHKARTTATYLLLLYALSAIIRTLVFDYVIGILRAGGDTTFCMVGETLAVWLVSVPLVLLGGLVLKWNIYALYALGCVCEIIKLIIFHIRVVRGKWIKAIDK